MKGKQRLCGALALAMTASVSAQAKPTPRAWNATTDSASASTKIQPMALRWNADQYGNHRYTVQVTRRPTPCV